MDIELGEFIILYAMTSHEETEDDQLLYVYLEHLRKIGREEAARKRAEELRKLKRKRTENCRKLERLLNAIKRRKVDCVEEGDIDMSDVFATEGNVSDFISEVDSDVDDSSESRRNLLLLNPNPVYYERHDSRLPQPPQPRRQNILSGISRMNAFEYET